MRENTTAFSPPFSVSSLCPLCSVWFILFVFGGCAGRERADVAPEGAATTAPAPQPYVETVPGSTVTFAMRPAWMPPAAPGEAGRYIWFAETETTWDAYDV